MIYQVHLSGYVLSGYVLSGYVLSGYILLECNLTGLVSCDISGTLVRLRFVRLRVAAGIRA